MPASGPPAGNRSLPARRACPAWRHACLVDVACTTPAALLGLGERKGRLEAGFDADVVVLDPVCCRELSVRGLHQGDYTPYEGLEVQGWPRHVWARGRHVVTEGVWSGPEQGSTGPAA